MVRCLLLLFVVCSVAAASSRAIFFRPLRIYAQQPEDAEAASGPLAHHFNVSIHHVFNVSCDHLIGDAQKFPDATAVILISNATGHCPKVLWTGASLVNLEKEQPILEAVSDPLYKMFQQTPGSENVNWTTYAEKLSQDNEIPPSMLYKMVPEERMSTEEPTTAAAGAVATKTSGFLVPFWVLVLLSVVLVASLVGSGVLGWLFWTKTSSPKDVEKGKEEEKSKEDSTKGKKNLPQPGEDKTNKTTTSSTTEKSEKNLKSPSEGTNKRKKVEKCSTKEEERSDNERSARSAEAPEKLESWELRSDIQQEKKQAEVIPPPERTLVKRVEEPMTKEDFVYQLNKLTLLIVDYCEDSSNYPVMANEKPGAIFKHLIQEIPQEPAGLSTAEQMLDFIKNTIFPGMTHWQHPRFHANFSCGRSYPDILAETFIASLGVTGSTWESCPSLIEMEYAMVNWVGKALGLPETFLFNENIEQSLGGGCFMETSSEAVLCTVLAARQWKIRQVADKELGTVGPEGIHYDLETMHETAKKLVFYASKEAHSSMEKSCKVAMVKCRSVPVDMRTGWGMTGEELERNIVKDKERGLVPTFVLVLLGSTASGASDDLPGILEVAKRHGLYIHVDAAYAGIFWIDPEFRNNRKGLEGVDSLNVSLHKAMLQSAPSAILFSREKKLLLDAFAATPKHIVSQGDGGPSADLRDWGLQSSRKFKSLKTWFVMKFYGIQGIQRYLRGVVETSEYFKKKVAEHPNLRLIGPGAFGHFCFQYAEKGWTREQTSRATTELARFLNQSTKILVTHTTLGEENVMRICTSYERTPKWRIDENFSTMCDLIDEFKQTKMPLNVVECAPMYPRMNRQRMPGDDDRGLVGSANAVTDRTRNSTSEATNASPMRTAQLQSPLLTTPQQKQP